MSKPKLSISPVIQCRIELVGTKPLVWRSIQILANSSLNRLNFAIHDMMFRAGFEPSHIKVGDDIYGDPNLDFEFEAWLDDNKMTVGRAFKIDHELEFVYGSGREWSLRVIFENTFPADPTERYPVCVSGENAEPPFGCAGPLEFEEFKRTIEIVTHPKPKNLLHSLKLLDNDAAFDPSFFDLRVLNLARLQRKKTPSRASKT